MIMKVKAALNSQHNIISHVYCCKSFGSFPFQYILRDEINEKKNPSTIKPSTITARKYSLNQVTEVSDQRNTVCHLSSGAYFMSQFVADPSEFSCIPSSCYEAKCFLFL